MFPDSRLAKAVVARITTTDIINIKHRAVAVTPRPSIPGRPDGKDERPAEFIAECEKWELTVHDRTVLEVWADGYQESTATTCSAVKSDEPPHDGLLITARSPVDQYGVVIASAGSRSAYWRRSAPLYAPRTRPDTSAGRARRAGDSRRKAPRAMRSGPHDDSRVFDSEAAVRKHQHQRQPTRTGTISNVRSAPARHGAMPLG